MYYNHKKTKRAHCKQHGGSDNQQDLTFNYSSHIVTALKAPGARCMASPQWEAALGQHGPSQSPLRCQLLKWGKKHPCVK